MGRRTLIGETIALIAALLLLLAAASSNII